MSEVVVVGGGIGGLATATLLQAAGNSVALFEARDYVGGCAATFHHGGRASEAGATWLTGFSPGMPLARLFAALEIDPATFGTPECDAMAIHFAGRLVRRYADADRWSETLREAYGIDGSAFWRKAAADNERIWRISARLRRMPPVTAGDWLRAAAAVRPADLALAGALRSTGAMLREAGLAGLMPLADAQLMITTQSRAAGVPWLYGAAGLQFAAMPARHVPGGIGGVAAALAARFTALGGRLKTGAPVAGVERAGAGWRVMPADGRAVTAGNVVLNLVHSRAAEVTAGREAAYFAAQAARHPAPLGAFDLHFRTAAALEPAGPRFFQVVLEAPLPVTGSRSIFVTVSPPGDPVLSRDGLRSLNISTHTPTALWWELDERAYADAKAQVTAAILERLERALPQFAAPRHDLHAGTPRTFANFVGRTHGSVGGYPLDYTNLPWRAAGPRTPFTGLWQIGDNVFPGQSIPGTALGALLLVERMTGRRY